MKYRVGQKVLVEVLTGYDKASTERKVLEGRITEVLPNRGYMVKVKNKRLNPCFVPEKDVTPCN